MKRFFSFIRFLLSFRSNPAERILKDTHPIDILVPKVGQKRELMLLDRELRRGINPTYHRYLKLKALQITTRKLDRENLKTHIYELMFFLLYWLDKIDEVEND